MKLLCPYCKDIYATEVVEAHIDGLLVAVDHECQGCKQVFTIEFKATKIRKRD